MEIKKNKAENEKQQEYKTKIIKSINNIQN